MIAGDFEDAAGLAGYERDYEAALTFSPAIWGVHPYVSVARRSEEPLLAFERGLPRDGAGAQVWFTEVGAFYCRHGKIVGQSAPGRRRGLPAAAARRPESRAGTRLLLRPAVRRRPARTLRELRR